MLTCYIPKKKYDEHESELPTYMYKKTYEVVIAFSTSDQGSDLEQQSEYMGMVI